MKIILFRNDDLIAAHAGQTNNIVRRMFCDIYAVKNNFTTHGRVFCSFFLVARLNVFHAIFGYLFLFNLNARDIKIEPNVSAHGCSLKSFANMFKILPNAVAIRIPGDRLHTYDVAD